ncbi:hypothetical protein NL676_030395, partial [Syzygium grande]
ATGGQCPEVDEGAEAGELLRPEDRRRCQHEHLSVPRCGWGKGTQMLTNEAGQVT